MRTMHLGKALRETGLVLAISFVSNQIEVLKNHYRHSPVPLLFAYMYDFNRKQISSVPRPIIGRF